MYPPDANFETLCQWLVDSTMLGWEAYRTEKIEALRLIQCRAPLEAIKDVPVDKVKIQFEGMCPGKLVSVRRACKPLPPVVLQLQRNGEGFDVLDGRHRSLAARMRGQAKIPAIVLCYAPAFLSY